MLVRHVAQVGTKRLNEICRAGGILAGGGILQAADVCYVMLRTAVDIAIVTESPRPSLQHLNGVRKRQVTCRKRTPKIPPVQLQPFWFDGIAMLSRLF